MVIVLGGRSVPCSLACLVVLLLGKRVAGWEDVWWVCTRVKGKEEGGQATQTVQAHVDSVGVDSFVCRREASSQSGQQTA